MLDESPFRSGLSAQDEAGLSVLIANAIQAELSYRKQRLQRIREDAAREQASIDALMYGGLPDYYGGTSA